MSASKKDTYRKQIGDQTLHPESLMMSYGYRPQLSEGSIKCPIFQTSTFVFKTAQNSPHQSSLDTVGLEQYERTLHGKTTPFICFGESGKF